MCQLPAPRALGVPLLTAFALTWPLMATAADAGSEQDAGVPEPSGSSDAGAEADAGTMPDLLLLFPPLGATDVVINPSFLLRAERAVLDPALASAPSSASHVDGLLLRDPLGNLVAVGSLLALQPPRYGGVEPRVELSSAVLELQANTRYEVLSRIGICDGSPNRSVCLQAEYRTLGAFETGIVFDHKPPSISSIRESAGSALACVFAFSVAASDDRAPPSALRFLVDEQAWLGPDLLLAGHPGFSFAPRPVQVVPVDPSGNRGSALTVDVGWCGGPPPYGDSTGGSYAPAPEPPALPELPPQPPRQQPHQSKHGCGLAAPASPLPSNLSVLALASLWLYRRQRRS